MNIRAYNSSDLIAVEKLHKQFFSDFELPNFSKMLCAFVVSDKTDIVTIGGLKPIAEIQLITNMNISTRKRVEALKEVKMASLFTCLQSKIDEAIAFTDNPEYKEQLLHNGFYSLGEGLGLKVHNG